MGLDEYRKNFNKKLDDFGEDAMRKIRAQREANVATTSSSERIGVKERLNMMKGDNPRWNNDMQRRRVEDGSPVEEGSSATRRMPPHSGYIGSKGPPPPPPIRRNPSVSSSSAAYGAAAHHGQTPPPAPAAAALGSRGAVPPPPPPRMANENGTANPPPPYIPTPGTEREQADYYDTAGHQQQDQYAQQQHGTAASWPVHPSGYVEFSKFTPQDKRAFWSLLDEYFDQKQRGLR